MTDYWIAMALRKYDAGGTAVELAHDFAMAANKTDRPVAPEAAEIFIRNLAQCKHISDAEADAAVAEIRGVHD